MSNEKNFLALDRKNQYLWLKDNSSVLYVSTKQINEIRILQTMNKLFNIYIKINLNYKMEDHLIEVKKTATAAKKFVEDFVKEIQKEEYIKNLKGTIYIKKKFIMGFGVIGTDLVAMIVNSSVPIILASYDSEESATCGLLHFIDTGNFKTEKIKLDTTSINALGLLMEEISQK